jgi:hypothetical protein
MDHLPHLLRGLHWRYLYKLDTDQTFYKNFKRLMLIVSAYLILYLVPNMRWTLFLQPNPEQETKDASDIFLTCVQSY